ncbi:MAG: hypothetical protein AAFU77_00540 [Myxococcota bacterium]
MDLDFLLRMIGMGALGGGIVIFVLGGLFTPIGGIWRDGDRIITLTQLGPWVSGTADRDGGRETYSGYAWFFRVRLARRSHGERHLRLLGFQADAVPVVDGAVTARLRFILRDRRLDGEFSGVRFDFSEPPVRILTSAALAPAQRSWTREEF